MLLINCSDAFLNCYVNVPFGIDFEVTREISETFKWPMVIGNNYHSIPSSLRRCPLLMDTNSSDELDYRRERKPQYNMQLLTTNKISGHNRTESNTPTLIIKKLFEANDESKLNRWMIKWLCPKVGLVTQKVVSDLTTIEKPKCTGIDKNGDTLKFSVIGIPPFRKVDEDVLNIIGSKLGFKLANKPERSWGSQGENGKWTGAIGSVVSGASDIAGCHISITEARFKAIDFILMYDLPISYMARLPLPLSPIWNVLKPFTNLVWYITILMLIPGFIASIFFNLYKDGKRSYHDYGDYILMVWKAQFNQSK